MRRIGAALGLLWRTSPWLTSLYVGLTVIGAVLPVGVVWLTKLLLDGIAGGHDSHAIVSLGAALGGMTLATGLVPFAVLFVQRETERRISLVAQDAMYQATERLVGMSRFEDPEFLNRLRLAQQYGGATPGVVVGSLLSGVSTLVSIAGFGGSLVSLSPWLPAGLLVTILPVLGIELWIAMHRSRAQWRLSGVERREMFYRDLLANTQAAKEIRLFGLAPYFRRRMTAERATTNRAQSAIDRREFIAQLGTGLLSGGFVAGALIWAASGAMRGQVSVGDIALLIASVTTIQMSSSSLMREIGRSRQQLLLFQSFLDIRDCPADLPVAESPSPVPTLRHGIELRDVWFRYHEHGPWVLQGVNLSIPAGTSLGIVGRNGAGKTTLVKLLLRMYDPSAGTILWDGMDIRGFAPEEFRQKVSAVFQDYMEYDLTARENIGLGDLALDFAPDVVEEAARTAEAHQFVEQLPRGYDTLLSRIFFEDEQFGADEGMVLSGGQWQRLAIARSYLRRNRDLMILDEPTSGLDAEAERHVHETLSRLRHGRTSILVSHRLGSLRNADHIVVLEGGTTVEQGTHAMLMAANSRYAQMFSAQAHGYEEDHQGSVGAPDVRGSNFRTGAAWDGVPEAAGQA